MNIIKTISTLMLSLAILSACNNDETKIPAGVVHNPATASGESNMDELPVMDFRESLHDFGTVIEGEKVAYSFKFTNSGGSKLLISDVSTSCGCTATKYTKDPVAPGEDGIITVTFDTRHRRGFQNKTITVSANTQPNKTVLRIKAKVITPGEL